MKIYTLLSKDEVKALMTEQEEHPERRAAQKALAFGATEVVHGLENAQAVAALTERLVAAKGIKLFDALVATGLASSKSEARKLTAAGAITVNGVKVAEDVEVAQVALLKRGKNKFAIVK